MPVDERQLLIRDAQLLIRQYENRNERTIGMTLEQRKAWAAEMVEVMRGLYEALDELIPKGIFIDNVQAWNEAMRQGKRKVTMKVPAVPPYGGVKLQPPPFKDDPTDPRGKPPRNSR